MRLKTILLLLTVLVLSVGSLNVHAASKPYCLVVYTADGSSTAFALAHHPKTTLYTRSFRVTSDIADVEFNATDVLRFTLEAIQGVVTPVEQLHAEAATADGNDRPQLSLTPGSISLNGLVPNSRVSIYDSGGHLTQSADANADGSLQLSMESLSTGVYIVRTEKTSFKIIRK